MTFKNHPKRTRKLLIQKMSIFYCIGFHFAKDQTESRSVRKLHALKFGETIFADLYPNMSPTEFRGVNATDFWGEVKRLETYLQHNIKVYTCSADGIDKFHSKPPVNLDSDLTFDSDPISLLHYGTDDYAYVKNVPRLLQSCEFLCEFCSSYFSKSCHLKNHLLTCPDWRAALVNKRLRLAREQNVAEDSVELIDEEFDIEDLPLTPTLQHVYLTGRYRPPKHIFDRLKDIGLDLDNVQLIYPFFIIFDCESLLKKADETVDWCTVTSAFVFETVHACCCIGMTSNVPGFDKPRAFIAEKQDPEKFVVDFLNSMITIAASAEAHYRDQIQSILEQIDDLKQQAKDHDPVQYKIISSVERRLDEYCQQIPVIGWNSSR